MHVLLLRSDIKKSRFGRVHSHEVHVQEISHVFGQYHDLLCFLLFFHVYLLHLKNVPLNVSTAVLCLIMLTLRDKTTK